MQREADQRYVEQPTGEGTVVIYDRTNDEAWIESDTTVSLACNA